MNEKQVLLNVVRSAALTKGLNYLTNERAKAITKNQLADKYQLNSHILSKIEQGETIARNTEKYMCAIVTELHRLRRFAENQKNDDAKAEIDAILVAMMLSLYSK